MAASAAIWSTDNNGDHVFDGGDAVFVFGLASDKAVVADWNGDTRSKVGVVRNNGAGGANWMLDTNDNFTLDASDLVFPYGIPTDVPVAGKW